MTKAGAYMSRSKPSSRAASPVSVPIKACIMYKDAAQSSIDLLGRGDKYTIRLQMDYATYLEESSRYSGALDVIAALKLNSKDSLGLWRDRILQSEGRLRYRRATQRHRERSMPVEQASIEDNKENVPESEQNSTLKKRKLICEIGSKSEERAHKIQS